MARPTTKLLDWYKKYGRKLPWRKTKNPYRILVSEIMLQQTQVERVLPFYKSWLKEFPTWKHLAKASNAQVIKAWAGLGYNKRALSLRDIAKQVVEQGVPQNAKEWEQLKGIGPYTAAAVSLFSGQDRVFPVDTNTRRVIGRVFYKSYFPQPSEDEKIQAVATKRFMGEKRADEYVQALFDLANTHCSKIPTCEGCPMRELCHSAPDFMKNRVHIPKQMVPKSKESIHRNKKFPDRIYRGRILKLIRESKTGVITKIIGPKIDKTFDSKQDKEWLLSMLERLEKDKLIKKQSKHYKLYD